MSQSYCSPVDVGSNSGRFDPVVHVQASHCIYTLDKLHIVKWGEAYPTADTNNTGI